MRHNSIPHSNGDKTHYFKNVHPTSVVGDFVLFWVFFFNISVTEVIPVTNGTEWIRNLPIKWWTEGRCLSRNTNTNHQVINTFSWNIHGPNFWWISDILLKKIQPLLKKTHPKTTKIQTQKQLKHKQHFYSTTPVSKLWVSSHANISVLLLLSWQVENTQSPTPISAAGSTNQEHTWPGGWKCPCPQQHQGSTAGMLRAPQFLGQLQRLEFQQSQAPGYLRTTNIPHAEGALTEALAFLSSLVSQLAFFWCFQTFFFFF